MCQRLLDAVKFFFCLDIDTALNYFFVYQEFLCCIKDFFFFRDSLELI